ncbi:S41 family peptidase [Hymenobacter swuensis]|uniref:S41 family peptidase n=1 Tax=Hymenobacter swuensis TaxID=1446467 RepID=UPI000694451C|nr:S41 family peptidase [Hymenobacter swuensis]
MVGSHPIRAVLGSAAFLHLDRDQKAEPLAQLGRGEGGDPVVAVLTDTLTASSGEAVAVAFKARKHTRSFGAGTCGVSTGRSRFDLSDGSVLLLTTAVFADRRLVRYGHSIAPDEPLKPAEVVPRATRWIREEYQAKN